MHLSTATHPPTNDANYNIRLPSRHIGFPNTYSYTSHIIYVFTPPSRSHTI